MVIMQHAACTSRELMPPTSYPHNHGAVSQYETLNLPYKSYTDFITDDVIDNEVIPLCRAPSPWKLSSTIGILSDPMLCVTPEKSHISSSTGNTGPTFTAPEKITKPQFPDVCQDPALALTPESSIKTAPKTLSQRHNNRERNCKKASKSSLKTQKDFPDNMKLKAKVRFDINSSFDSDLDKHVSSVSASKSFPLNKIYHPSLYSDGSDTQVGYNSDSGQKSRTIDYVIYDKCFDTVTEGDKKRTDRFCSVKDMSDDVNVCGAGDARCVNVSDVISASEEVEFDENVKPKTISYRTYPECDRSKESAPVDSSPTEPIIPKNKPKRKVVVTREFEERPRIEEYQFPFSNDDDVESDYEHVFARPEYNSALILGAQIHLLKESHPDVQTVLQKTLTESEEKRTEINEKAASKVNIPFSHMSGLVGVEVPDDKICRVEKEMTQKAKLVKQKISSKPKPSKSAREPDLLEFFGPEFQRELPDFSLPGLMKPTVHLATASHDSAFDLYRHNRVWEGFAKK